MSIDPTPWYRQFWPWFLIALPMTAVLGGAVTVWIAFNHETGLVSESYYQDGLSINQQLQQQRLARDAQLEANILLSDENQLITLHLSGNIELPETLNLTLFSSFDPDLDSEWQLKRVNNSLYRSVYSHRKDGAYYLSVSSPDNRWRMDTRIQLPLTSPVRISHNGGGNRQQQQ